jgi:hypothetical protein
MLVGTEYFYSMKPCFRTWKISIVEMITDIVQVVEQKAILVETTDPRITKVNDDVSRLKAAESSSAAATQPLDCY